LMDQAVGSHSSAVPVAETVAGIVGEDKVGSSGAAASDSVPHAAIPSARIKPMARYASRRADLVAPASCLEDKPLPSPRTARGFPSGDNDTSNAGLPVATQVPSIRRPPIRTGAYRSLAWGAGGGQPTKAFGPFTDSRMRVLGGRGAGVHRRAGSGYRRTR
jgi:hypothetical protein